MMFTNGAQIGFYQGDVKRLTEDMAELKPTIFATVPRLLNRLYDKVAAQIIGQLGEGIFQLCILYKFASYGIVGLTWLGYRMQKIAESVRFDI